jgi:hypothetical protein
MGFLPTAERVRMQAVSHRLKDSYQMLPDKIRVRDLATAVAQPFLIAQGRVNMLVALFEMQGLVFAGSPSIARNDIIGDLATILVMPGNTQSAIDELFLKVARLTKAGSNENYCLEVARAFEAALALHPSSGVRRRLDANSRRHGGFG